MPTLKKDFASGGAHMSKFTLNNAYDLMKEIIENQKALIAWLATHTHGSGAVADQAGALPSDDLTIES